MQDVKINNTDFKDDDIKNIIVKITNIEFIVDADPDIYDDNEYLNIKDIVTHMSKEIWIDKTYVAFKNSIWSDAFIVEDKWYELVSMVKDQLFGKKLSKLDEDIIAMSWVAVVITYMYEILYKYGYNTEAIDLSLNRKKKMRVEYFNDTRTTWES